MDFGPFFGKENGHATEAGSPDAGGFSCLHCLNRAKGGFSDVEALLEIIGVFGMVGLLSAFFLASRQILDDRKITYHFLNLFGAAGIVMNAFYKEVWSVTALESVWCLLALVGIWKAARKRAG